MRSRLSFANVAATIALVFAMSGGAIAAQRYLLTSTTQISPKVLRALKGKAGPRGASGRAGAPGINGAGVTGRTFSGAAVPCAAGGSEFTAANGATFACNGKDGKDGKDGKPGKEPKEPPPVESPSWPGVLPSGKTETGTWGFTSHWEGSTRVPISFTVPTATVLTGPVELLEPNEEDPIDTHPHCPGSVEKPAADPGFLCIYAASLEAAFLESGSIRTSGVVLAFDSKANTPETAEGSWAMTAP